MKDYINDTFLRLTEEGRIRDAVAFCERVAEEAPYAEFRCIALKDLAECHFFMTGDGEACREANLRGIRCMEEEYPEILEGTEHMARDLVQRMYSDFCEQFRSVAVSFEEYEEYCEKPLKVREQNAAERRGLMAVEELKSENAGWKENMFQSMDQYFPQDQAAASNAAAPQAACLAQLILINRRKLRTQPLDVNFAMQQYTYAVVGCVEKLIQESGKMNFPPDADQLCFLFDRVQTLIETMRSDRQADQPTVDACLQKLAEARTRVEELCARPEVRKEIARAGKQRDYLTLKKLNAGFGREMGKLRKLSLGQTGALQGSEKARKIKKCLGWLLFFVILFAFAWGVWQLNLLDMTR